VCEAHWFESPRNRSPKGLLFVFNRFALEQKGNVRDSFKPPRAPRVRLVALIGILLEIHSNFVQYTPQTKTRFRGLFICGGESCQKAGRERFEDLVRVFHREANEKPTRYTETVSFKKRNRGLSASANSILYRTTRKRCQVPFPRMEG